MSNGQVVIGIGELLWDCFGEERRPGGAPANVAFHATKLGLRGIVVSRVGGDELGRELVHYLGSRGMDTSQIQIDGEYPTGQVAVDVSDASNPTYTIHEGVAWDRLAFHSELRDTIRSAAAVCVGTLAQRSEPSRETIGRCLREAEHALVIYDINLRQHYYDRSIIESTLQHTDVVKLNLDEVGLLAELLGAPSSDPLRFCRELLARTRARLICVTRASEGCLLVTAGEEHDVCGVKVPLADSVGAGDAFTAALITAQLRQWPLAESAWFANQFGALVAGRDGAMPDLDDEARRLIQQVEAGCALDGREP